MDIIKFAYTKTSSKSLIKSFVLELSRRSKSSSSIDLIPSLDGLKNATVKQFSDIPGPKRLPIIGNLYLYKLGFLDRTKYHDVLKMYRNRYGPVVREDLGDDTIIHVFEPEDVEIVHSVTGKTPEIPPLSQAMQLYRQDRNLTLGLGNMNGEDWYKLRSAVQKMMMRPKEVQYYIPFIDEVAKDFVTKIEGSLKADGQLKQDLRKLVAKWNMESSGIVCFEKRLGCFDSNESVAERMIQANIDIFELSACLKFSIGLHNYVRTPKWKRFEEAEDYFFGKASEMIDDSIKKIQQLIETKKLKPNQYNFLSYLLSKDELSVEDVRIITFSLFADGLSTTTPALIYNLYALAKFQNVQEKVYNEIKEEFQNPKDPFNINILNNLQYLKAFVKETFRFLPGGTEVARILPVDVVLSGYNVPAGTHVDLNQFIHLDSPEYFTRPEEFLPERWIRNSSENISNDIHPYLMTPFGHGTRMCAGRRFAEQDIYTSLVRLLQRFQIELVHSDEKMERIYSTLLFPKNPLELKFIRRKP